MGRKLFLAGAFGVIGVRVIPMLIADGWHVQGMTRSQERADAMKSLGVDVVLANAFDAERLKDAVAAFAPDVLMHQLTDLPRELSKLNDAALAQNAKLRRVGTRNLVDAAKAAGVQRLVVQSIAFNYDPTLPRPYKETDRLAGRLPQASETSNGVVSLEHCVSASDIPFAILRYGRLYGPGTGSDRPWGPAGVHVDAAARAAALAALNDEVGIFNIAEDDGEVDSTRACAALGWSPDWRA